jgi:hypothetical protein
MMNRDLSQKLVQQGNTVFLSSGLELLPPDMKDPVHQRTDSSNSQENRAILSIFQATFMHAPCWLLVDDLDYLAAKDETNDIGSLMEDRLFYSSLQNSRSLFLSLLDRAISMVIFD